MSAFLAGAAGALFVLASLLALALLARAVHRRRWRGAGGPRRGAAFLARRIGARPDQERLIADEADALLDELRTFRAAAAATRGDLARLLVADALDERALADVLDRPLARLGEARARVAAALARVHAALDPAQRAALAAVVERGPRHGRRHAHA
jgi:hypothetical protein